MKFFKVIFFVLSIAIVSCKKDAYDPKKISFDELEMVVRVNNDGLDTVQTFENSDFGAALILDQYQRSLQVYEQDHLLRSVIGQEVTFNKTENSSRFIVGSFDQYLSYHDLHSFVVKHIPSIEEYGQPFPHHS